MPQLTKIHNIIPRRSSSAMDGVHLSAESIKALASDAVRIAKLGIGVPKIQQAMNQLVAMDSGFVNPVTTPSTGTPIQFLQSWLPGVIYILTVARKADVLAPIAVAGKWTDEEIIQMVNERLGSAGIYKDHGDVPLTSWNLTYDRRDIFRAELGLQVQKLEDERGSAIGVSSAAEKRAAVTLAFEMLRNDIFFHGYCVGGKRCYGILNDPNLPNFCEVAAGTGGKTEWSSKTVNEIVSDILTALRMLRIQSGGNIDPKSTPILLALPLSCADLLHEVDGANSFGFTVQKWLSENYPNIKIEIIPQFDKVVGAPANGVEKANIKKEYPDNPNNGSASVDGKNVFYLYAESVAGSGTDDGRTMLQIVPSRMQSLNTVMNSKGYTEAYTAAYSGCYVKRPYAVTRFYGI